MPLKKEKKRAEDSKFFKGLKAGLEDVVAYKKGKMTLRTENIEIPAPPREYKAKDIKRIRVSGNYSQGLFAKVLNVSIKTVQSCFFWNSCFFRLIQI